MSKKAAKEENAAEIHIVKLSQIEPNPSNPRKSFPEQSLKELGEHKIERRSSATDSAVSEWQEVRAHLHDRLR